MTDASGKPMMSREVNKLFLIFLERVYEEEFSLFSPQVASVEDVHHMCSTFKYLRRDSDTRAIELGVPSADIDVVNHWKGVESTGFAKSSNSMQQHYTEVSF